MSAIEQLMNKSFLRNRFMKKCCLHESKEPMSYSLLNKC